MAEDASQHVGEDEDGGEQRQEDAAGGERREMERVAGDYIICSKKHLVPSGDKERVRAGARGGSVL